LSKRWLTNLLPLLALSGCVHDTARSRITSALQNAGLSPPVSACMAEHLVDKLSIPQLRKLETLKGARNPLEYALALRRIDDPQVVRVALAAAALCMTGWER
jgi:hypothetical protein